MIDLRGKTALVTGGSGVIGSAIVRALAEAGALVTFTFNRNSKAASELKCSFTNCKPGFEPVYWQMDVTDSESVCVKMAGIQHLYEHLDILVNCAGINRPAAFDKILEDDWDDIMNVNLRGPWLVTQEALPLLREGASVINIGSVSGHIGGPTTTHYCASKAGLVGLTHNMALFLAPRGIRANCVSPGYVESPLADAGSQSPAVRDTIATIPLGRLGTAAEVAAVVCFLASDAAAYVTGQVWHVNGGLYFG